MDTESKTFDLSVLEALAVAVRDDPMMAACLVGALDHRYEEVCGGLDSADWGLSEARAECARIDRFVEGLHPDRFRSTGTYVANLDAWVAAGMPVGGPGSGTRTPRD